MSYASPLYLAFFLPVVLIIYQLFPQKLRWLILLLASYGFFFLSSKKLIVYLLLTTLLIYACGRLMAYLKDKCKEAASGMDRKEASSLKKAYKKKEKYILIAAILILLATLAYLKYYNFFVVNSSSLLSHLGLSLVTKNLALPLGISFYTLEAIGYLADVYWGKIDGRQPLGKVALFLAFFPQLMEGPIAMYHQTADDLWAGRSLKLDNLIQAAIRMLWGIFKKMVVADRLNTLVVAVFNHYHNYHGCMIVIAAIAYATQLYMEFSGCMDIIIASGQMFGIKLPENFNQPFASKSAAEFWRRWHMTLGVWFKTYIFYPVSMSKLAKKWNKFAKARFGKYIAKLGVSAICLFPVWLANGLWHGARWSYIFYGMYYFVILFTGLAIEPLRDKVVAALHLNMQSGYYRFLQTAKTWCIIFTGELFFRANGLKAGFSMFFSIFHSFNISCLWNGSLLKLGLDRGDFMAICYGVILAAVVGTVKEKKLLGEEGLYGLKTPLRWTIYYGLILGILILGAYGAGYTQVDMIYAKF